MSSYQIVKRLPAAVGRDFVVGDIHGTFDVLLEALKAVSFNPQTDRLFSVGDLIDRGNYSGMALEFLQQPWVYAVRGNHEQMLLDMYAGDTLDTEALKFNVERNGMGWWLETSDSFKYAFLTTIAKLPIALEVESILGKIGIIHAEVPFGMDWPLFIAQLESFDNRTFQSALWGRSRLASRHARDVAGIYRIYAGHTPQLEGVKRLGNCCFIDTGAVFGAKGVAPGKLSMVNLVCNSNLVNGPTHSSPGIDLFLAQSNI